MREIDGKERLTDAQPFNSARFGAHHTGVDWSAKNGRVLGGTIAAIVDKVVVAVKIHGSSDQVCYGNAEIHGGQVEENLPAATAQLFEADEGRDDQQRADDGERAGGHGDSPHPYLLVPEGIFGVTVV